ncbi:MAG TPA: hypothetical protein VF677_00300 [Flavobacterium sp.]|jgi:hypothetical protein
MRIVRSIINHLTQKPKTLFLIDSLGAMFTAFVLFTVVRNFNQYFGMPKTIVTYLSAIAGCFSIFSTSCFLLLQHSWIPFIRGISFANSLYCILIILLLIIYYPQLTSVGIIYFIAEIVIIYGLVYIELNVAAEIKKNRVVKSM